MRALLAVCVTAFALGAQPLPSLGGIAGIPASRDENPVAFHPSLAFDTTSGALVATLAATMPHEVHFYAADTLFFLFELDSSRGVEDPVVELPGARPYRNFDGSMVAVYGDGARFRIRGSAATQNWVLHGSLRFQACTATMCYPPRRIGFQFSPSGGALYPHGERPPPVTTDPLYWQQLAARYRSVGSMSGYQGVEPFSAFLRNPADHTAGGFEGRGWWAIMLLALLGGLALNLTPCVLPMLPVTLAVIGGASSSRSRARGVALGGAYGLGMAVAYGALGVVVALTGAQFGALNASPLFNFVIAALFVVLGLAMFDLIPIDLTRFRTPAAKGGTLAGVFSMGVVTALLAGACVAPVVISTVVYAATLYAQGNSFGLLIPFVLGAGMAIPWPLAGGGLTLLPRPGRWMVWVRTLFGVLILVLAFSYARTGWRLVRPPDPHTSSQGAYWEHSLVKGLERGLAEGKPVLLDFWATWCKNCLAMDATTFRDPGVQELFEGYVGIKYQAEVPDEPATAAVLAHFGVIGLPTYVVLHPLPQAVP